MNTGDEIRDCVMRIYKQRLSEISDLRKISDNLALAEYYVLEAVVLECLDYLEADLRSIHKVMECLQGSGLKD